MANILIRMEVCILAQNDIGIDLGTTTIIISMEGKGVVLCEPTIVAVDTKRQQVLAVGNDAFAMVGRTPAYILAIRPLKDGVISNHMLTKELICRFIGKVYDSHLIKPRVSVCVPAAITGIEADAVVESVISAGARQVFLIDEPIAAALGAGIDITKPYGHMVIDMGGGTTDVAVIALGGKVRAASVNVAGNTYDEEIVKAIRQKFNLAIGEKSAENLKKNIACCDVELDYCESAEVKGRNLITGLPQKITVTTKDLYEPVLLCAEQIVAAAHSVLEKTPPELSGDIFTEGIYLTGGSALLKGLSTYCERMLKVKTIVADDPINCVSRGAAKSLVLENTLESGFRDATPHIGKNKK
ncbi:MAG: rod shape-determining protein [Oscillospiraceae bacterium]